MLLKNSWIASTWFEKAAEVSSVWRTVRRDCCKPALRAHNWIEHHVYASLVFRRWCRERFDAPSQWRRWGRRWRPWSQVENGTTRTGKVPRRAQGDTHYPSLKISWNLSEISPGILLNWIFIHPAQADITCVQLQSQQELDDEDSQLMRLGKTVLTTNSGKQTSVLTLCVYSILYINFISSKIETWIHNKQCLASLLFVALV